MSVYFILFSMQYASREKAEENNPENDTAQGNALMNNERVNGSTEWNA